ncbi:heme-binding beta-barrel domain-containing protein [Polaribacter sp. Q13]|uniref:heme-binding beta-barrel domain-containing protein n=1 Tax=Polaribacter sp. Q13 TaxID=2806551 RepID=UPI00193B4AA6|nr:heme-binding beta-barrel domain-containing protein [Polaribacter sp. Q13]QVY66180.1 FABP family protein [Polaribacter sp. Q13]
MSAVIENPLVKLIGVWKGAEGIDLAPKPDEDENNPYYEVLTIEPVDLEIENAEEQELVSVRYHQIVREKANNKVSHSETGYWIWDKNEHTIMNSFSITRGVSVLAGGEATEVNNELKLSVAVLENDTKWGIVQSPFMLKKAKTLSFKRTFTVIDNKLSYTQETLLDIYGKTFSHTDVNTLYRV